MNKTLKVAAVAVTAAALVAAGWGASAMASNANATDAACLALTGASSCDWTRLTPCAVEDGGPELPCAWIASRDGNRQGEGVYVYLDHPCPPIRGAVCFNVRDDPQ